VVISKLIGDRRVNLNLIDNADVADNFPKLGDVYKHSQYEYGSNEADTFLAGEKYFQLDEIEIYHKE